MKGDLHTRTNWRGKRKNNSQGRWQRNKRVRLDDGGFMVLMYTTQNNVEIHVERGTKSQSPHDFIVKFRQPEGRLRTPTHVHLIVELYVKQAHNPQLTDKLALYLLGICQKVQPINYFPPTFQIFNPADAQPFLALDAVGEFSVEFLLAVSELIFIQEKTNYPAGSLTSKLYQGFLTQDRFSVVSAAVWKNM